jgi:Inositol hexakisphosphate
MFISKIFIALASFLLLNVLLGHAMASNESILIINMENDEILPRNFRIAKKPSTATIKPSFEGIDALRSSASGQFSEKSLNKILKTLPTNKIILMDLREESHGFINGIAISWFSEYNWANKGKTLAEILADEQRRLTQLSKEKNIVLGSKKGDTSPLSIEIKEVYNEEELAKSLGLDYVRIPVTDHVKPSDESLDRFINFIKAYRQNKNNETHWIHFHCAAGRGRSTTFIALYDMILNASKVSFEDILARQALIGGKDLTEPFSSADWRYTHGTERLQFLANFYKYSLENPELEVSWSSWIASYK